MSKSAGRDGEWGGWTAEEPADIGFAWAPADGGGWRASEEDGLEHRELGLADASQGAMQVELVRVAEGVTPSLRWVADDVSFDFDFVLEGAVTLETEAGERIRFEKGGSAVHPPGSRKRWSEHTNDFRAVRITAPAAFESEVGEAATFAGASGPVHAGVYGHDTEESYERGAGPRKYFLYRDLGTAEPTEGRIHIHIVRATEPGEGTGWHYHTMAQWFLILRGEARIAVEDHTVQPLGAGDAMCVGRGPRMRHNVAPFSGDYVVLEMCVPAVYDTIAVDRPDGAPAMNG